MIRVLVVDDSAIVRRTLTEELSKFDDVEVVGQAANAYEARDRIVELKPDVLTLDIEMPKMDGLSFLQRLMKHYPLPVVIVSSVAQRGSENALRAMQLGAIEVVPKPSDSFSVPDVARFLIMAIRAAATANLKVRRMMTHSPTQETAPTRDYSGDPNASILAVGSSTGGTRALEHVLARLPSNTPPVVIVQHMPPGFTASFAERLNTDFSPNVKEGRSGEELAPGTVYIAPGGFHMMVRSRSGRPVLQVKEGPPVNFHRPSVDVLLGSLAQTFPNRTSAAILTGMGSDGARGLLALRQAGAHTLAQDEATSVVWGMPRAAYELGGAEQLVPLDSIARHLLQSSLHPLQSA